ncbi:MAG: hypothetical protein A3K10_10370 [Bacteroidetes bacterium RIFCSPLOWO2_12_FULL_31_6]|nr:MAG: hypothetical protein A3K10_10370 [Bacteroidetes bacterium RIFCSPLOWO2_12_FULL_31_6]
MIRDNIKIWWCSLLLFCSIISFGQEVKNDSIELKQYQNAVYIELLGANGYLSVNYERNLLEKNKIELNFGVGVGFFYSIYTPRIFSVTLRTDLNYQLMKNVKPTVGFAISQVLEVNEDGSESTDYLVPAPNIGIDFILLKRFHLLPKYYLLISKRSDYYKWDMMNWGGLQLKYDF